MTWIRSPNLASSLATEAFRLVCDSQAYEAKPCVTLSGTPTARDLSLKESTTGSWMMRHYGTMSEPLTGDPGVDTWILLLRDSRASHTQSPDSGVEKLMNAISGLTPLESFGKWDQATSSLRTSQVCLFPAEGQEVTLQPWLENFPPSGTMRSGTAYRLRPLVPRTSVGGGGALPTPQAADALGIGRPMEQMYRTESGKVRFKRNQGVDGAAPLHTIAATGMWPTPRAGNPGSRPNGKGGKILAEEVKLWPTPTSTERSGINPNTGKGAGLSKVVAWPTPRVSDHGNPGEHGQGGQDLRTQVGGQLNPAWVEWLMGLPIGWTDLKPLAMESYQQWLQSF